MNEQEYLDQWPVWQATVAQHGANSRAAKWACWAALLAFRQLQNDSQRRLGLLRRCPSHL